MKIKVEFEIREMEKAHETMLEVAEEFEATAPDTLFAKRRVNLKAIKVNQEIGSIDIDIDSDFTLWCLDRTIGLFKFIKPVWFFIERCIHELGDWIQPIKEAKDEDIKKEFDV